MDEDALGKLFSKYTPHHYDINGKPYADFLQWARDFENTKKRTLARTYLWWGGEVSTVWLGLDHGFGNGPPLIFETMIFNFRRYGSSLDMDRYATRRQAFKGHREMIRRWSRPSAMFLAIWNASNYLFDDIRRWWGRKWK